jgi:hypothetical protein
MYLGIYFICIAGIITNIRDIVIYYFIIVFNHYSLLLLLLTTVTPQTYTWLVGQFPHPEVMPVIGYEENKEIDWLIIITQVYETLINTDTSPIHETWNKPNAFWSLSTGDGAWEICRKLQICKSVS